MQTVDELVTKNLAAKGGLERLRAVKTVRQTSRMTMQGIEAQFTMLGKRPNLIRQQILVQGQTIVMAYDGAVPWMVNPLLGSTSPIVVSGPQAAMIREQSSFDGPLVDYKERGTKVEFVGADAVDGRKAWHLRLTSKTGEVQHCYLDAATYLEMKLVSDDMGKMEQELSDYRDVEGIKIPFRVRLMQNGVVQSEIKVDKVEFNIAVDDAAFRLPKK
jgi:outer membrane lipoprotein-sorting protein